VRVGAIALTAYSLQSGIAIDYAGCAMYMDPPTFRALSPPPRSLVKQNLTQISRSTVYRLQNRLIAGKFGNSSPGGPPWKVCARGPTKI